MWINNLGAIILLTFTSGCASNQQHFIFEKDIQYTPEMQWIEGEFGPLREVNLPPNVINEINQSESQALLSATNFPMMASEWISYKKDGDRFFLVRPYEINGAVGYATWTKHSGLINEHVVLNSNLNIMLVKVIESACPKRLKRTD